MIIKNIKLCNFRVFKGTHEIDLEPQKDKRIILFGGLNGAGKTSILTGIRFALLGRSAIEGANTQALYVQKLNELIHGNDENAEASVEIEFDYFSEGKRSIYKVARNWTHGKADTLSILRNDEPVVLSYEQAQSFLFELVPPGIADLVFFDGEKIAELAEDTSGVILKQAVKRLLGLDTIGKLKEDLAIYLKRLGIDAASDKLKKAIDSIIFEKEALLAETDEIRIEADRDSRSITELNKKIEVAEQDVLTGGGAWAEDKEAEKKKVDDLLEKKLELESLLLRELDGAYALTLAPKTTGMLLEHLRKEQSLSAKKSFQTEFDKLLPSLEVKLKDKESSLEILMEEVKNYSSNDEKLDFELGLSSSQSSTLERQIEEQSLYSKDKVLEIKRELSEVINQIEHSADNIARAPEKEQLQQAFSNLKALQEDKNNLVKRYREALTSLKSKLTKIHQITVRLSKMHSDQQKVLGNDEGADRATKIISFIEHFSETLIHARLCELEQEFIASYKRLARKEDLQITAKIDHDNFDVVLLDTDGHSVNRASLSAGEKQIYAISMLDALAKVSGRKLPVVIDTPLGRLDSHHRDKLVENYFPEAAEQVIILSTDTEIDEEFFKGLEDSLSHSYEIIFNPSTRSSSVAEGYFWHSNALMEAV